MITRTSHGSSSERISRHLHIIHVCGGCLLLIRPSPLSSSSSSTSSCSLSSSSRRTWQTCAAPRRMRRTPWTSRNYELYDSSVTFSFKIPSTDQDVDDLTRKFQSSTFDTVARRKVIQNQNTILELCGRVQELQNEVNCMNDYKDFQDAESVRSGNSHVTSRPVSFPPHPIPEGMLSRSFVTPSRREGPPSIWDTHGISGNVFANPDAS